MASWVFSIGFVAVSVMGIDMSVLATPFEKALASVNVIALPESVAAAEPVTNSCESVRPSMSFTIAAEAVSFAITTVSPFAGTSFPCQLAGVFQLPLPPTQVQVLASRRMKAAAANAAKHTKILHAFIFISFYVVVYLNNPCVVRQ